MLNGVWGMDAKVFRLTLLTIASAFLLVIVILYATNADKINRLFGREKSAVTEAEYVQEDASVVSEESYAQQIGDDLKSFLYDDDFFDEAEQIPAVVVIQQNTKTVSDSSEDTSEQPIDEDERSMAVVGQLDNPDAAFGSSSLADLNGLLPGNLTEPPIEGTPVGNTP